MYLGISASKFDELVRDGRMPSPKRIDGRRIWDVHQLDLAFDALPVEPAMSKITLPYIHEYRDRHGKVRRYFRRPGVPRVPLIGAPGSAEFMAAYQAALSGLTPTRQSRNGPGTFRELVTDYYRSPEFANLRANSQRLYRLVLGPLAEKHGHRLVRDLEPIRLGPLFRTWAPLGPAWPISLSRSSRGSWHSLLR